MKEKSGKRSHWTWIIKNGRKEEKALLEKTY